MRALTFDKTREDWTGSTGMVLEDVPEPEIGPGETDQVLVRVRYTGFCGSDRGMWSRKAFGDMVLGSLAAEGRTRRIFGHEMMGEVVAVGRGVKRVRVGDTVSTESHIVCGQCYQCRRGEFHVCSNEKIIGISMDGCFADLVKLPERALWPTDLGQIRPEVAAIQEPFGNAVHACQVRDLKDQSVAILGTGAIGQFAILVARGMGARQVIGIEPDASRAEMALKLGAEAVIAPGNGAEPWSADPDLRGKVLELTGGVGVDVALEMAGFNGSVNNAISIVRRGGTVVLFGVKNGDATIQDLHRVVMNGVRLEGVVGRRLFSTWETTKRLLEEKSNGIERAIWEIILNRGDDTVVDMAQWDRTAFEGVIDRHPKAVLKWS
ncbi:MAG: alcohol dehydrogenase catalytic domain-containing protein [Deltaproteobacteria bacterium]|nr:alcohol dehydrogenase catalytic domain-containing protein [Deltaproteobacteria bacterium]